MSTEDEVTIWTSTLDGKYTVKVIWIAPYRCELTIAMKPQCFTASQ